jgi:hypothetical protein
MKTYLSFLIVALGFATMAQAQQTKGYKITHFENLEISISADVSLSQGEASLQINGDAKDLEEITVAQEGNTVVIKSKNKSFFGNHGRVKVQISMPEIKKLSFSGSVELIAAGTIHADELSIHTSGSSKLEFRALELNSGDISASGSGEIILAGTKSAKNLEFHCSGSTNIQARGLLVENVDIHVSGSGDAEVNCSKTLNVSASGSSDVVYWGNPKVNSSVSGSGSVKSAKN